MAPFICYADKQNFHVCGCYVLKMLCDVFIGFSSYIYHGTCVDSSCSGVSWKLMFCL